LDEHDSEREIFVLGNASFRSKHREDSPHVVTKVGVRAGYFRF
jgi:hypothetical protein